MTQSAEVQQNLSLILNIFLNFFSVQFYINRLLKLIQLKQAELRKISTAVYTLSPTLSLPALTHQG